MPIARHQAVAVGTAPVLLTFVDDSILNETQTIWGLTVANVAGVDCKISLYVTNSKGVSVYIMKDVLLPAENMFGLGEDAFNFVLLPGDSIYVQSNVAASADVTMTTRNYL